MVKRFVGTVCVVVFAACSASAQQERREDAKEPPGIAVGEKAPEFKLLDQAGEERELKQFLAREEEGNETGQERDPVVALVFYRSADWCPFCQRQLIQLQADFDAIQEAQVRLVGISYDSPEILKAFTEKHKIAFPLLSDPESKVIDAYQLRNEDARAGTRQDGIPHPVTVVVDHEGVVRARLGYDVRKRHSTEELVRAALGVGE